MGIYDGVITDSEDDGALTEPDATLHSPAQSKPATFTQPNDPAIPPLPSTEHENENPILASAELRKAQIAADTAAILSNTDSSSASFPPTLPLPTKSIPATAKAQDIYDFNPSSDDESDSIAVVPAPSAKKKRSLTVPALHNHRHDDEESDDDWGAATTSSKKSATKKKKKKKKEQPKKRTRTLPTNITSLISSSEDELAGPSPSVGTTITVTRKKRERKEVNYYIPLPPGSTPSSPPVPKPSSSEEVRDLPEPTPVKQQKTLSESLQPTPVQRPNPNIIIDLSHPDLILATQQKKEYIPVDTSPRFRGTLESLVSTMPDGSMEQVEVPPVPKELLEKSFVEPGYEEEIAVGTGSTGGTRRSKTVSVTGSGSKDGDRGITRRSKTGLGGADGWEAGRVASEWRAAKGRKNYKEVLPGDDEEWGTEVEAEEEGGRGKKGKKETKKKEKKAPAKKRKKTGEASDPERSTGGTAEEPGIGAAGSHSEATPQASTETFSVPPHSSPPPDTIKVCMSENSGPSIVMPPPDSPTIRFEEPEQPSLRIKLNVGRRAATAFAHVGSGSEKGSSPQRRYKRTKSRFPDGDELESELSDVPTKPTPARRKSRAVLDEGDKAQEALSAAKKPKTDAPAEPDDEQVLDMSMVGKSRKKLKAAQNEEEDWGGANPKKTPARTKSKATQQANTKSRKKSKAPVEETNGTKDEEPAPQPGDFELHLTAEQPVEEPAATKPARKKSKAVISDSEDSGSLTPPPPSPKAPTPPPPRDTTLPPQEEEQPPSTKRKRTKSAKQMPPLRAKKQKPAAPEPEPEPEPEPKDQSQSDADAEMKPESESVRASTPATPAPVGDEKKEGPGTPRDKKMTPRPAHSPIRANNKVPFRVGLSRRHRIEPLLKVVKRKP